MSPGNGQIPLRETVGSLGNRYCSSCLSAKRPTAESRARCGQRAETGGMGGQKGELKEGKSKSCLKHLFRKVRGFPQRIHMRSKGRL